MRALALFAVLLGFAASARGEVTVQRGRDGRLDIRATTAPLPEVLDHLARQTGMKVLYDGPPPRPLLTLTLEGRTPVEALLGVLEGLGLNYAVVMDASATRVDTLLMAGVAPPASASISPAPPPRPAPGPFRPRITQRGDPSDATEAEEPADDEPVLVPGQTPPVTPQPGASGPAPLPTPAPSPQMPAGFPMGPPGMTPPNYPTSPFAPRLFPPVVTPGANPFPGNAPLPEPTPPP